jgi:hypothetical protein
MDGARPPATSPAVNSARPTAKGRAVPRVSASCPATTIPRRLPRKNPLNTQPYRPRPPRSSDTTGSTVEMARASNATRVIVRTSPVVRRRRSGAQTPSWAGRVASTSSP